MSFPPLHPSQNSLASSDSKLSNSGSARPRQSAWGLPAQSSSRRGLTPLATSVKSTAESSGQRPGSSSGPSSINTSVSPFAPTFSSVLNSSARLSNNRIPSSASATSPSLPSSLQTGSQQLSGNQSLSSPRSRATTPFSNSNLASAAAISTAASQGGGGGGGSSGGGGPSKPAAFSPAPSSQGVTSPVASTFDRNPFGSSNSLSNSSQSSVSKIVVTQVFLLLGSITEKEGKVKWDSQAEAIRKLVDSHGMEVFAKYFRRLIVGNSPQIFSGISRNVENPGNYQLLVEEVEKASRDSQQALKIAEIIDTSEGDIFRDFDLATFINHFNLDPVAQTILASAFTQVTKADLRAKAASLLSSTFQPLAQAFATFENLELDIRPARLAIAAFRILYSLPSESRDGSERNHISLALESGYMKQNRPLPMVIRSAIALVDIMEGDSDLAQELMKYGPSSTASVENAKTFLRRYNRAHIDAAQVGVALLYVTLNPEADQHQPENLIAALRDQSSLDIQWQQVLKSFDREGLVISQEQFLSIYQSLYPIAKADSSFDIQLLWGGQWQHKATQLSFAVALASLSGSQLDATTIPNLRAAYDPREWNDAPEEFAPMIEAAAQDPMISLDAIVAIIEGLWDPGQASAQDLAQAKHVVGEKMTLFLSSAGGIPKPWVGSHQALMSKTVTSCLNKSQVDYPWILHCLWKEDKTWLASRLMEIHNEDPLQLPLLLEHASEHNWLEDLCTMVNGFGIDLAALAHRKGLIDLHQWAEAKIERNPVELSNSLARFLVIKAQDELRTSRNEQPAPRTVSLAMKTVHAMLEILEEQMKDRREELLPLERQCMQAFPRLCNYAEGFDEIIEANGADGNGLPEAADAEMQDLYKRMYSAELEVRHVIEALRDCKNSENSGRQELFACMIHGLFDEFVCFNEYPLNPLATTAVLFGGIINYRLINNFALNVGLEMVLESVRDYNPESSMYKFGLQALMHFLGRLQEWPEFCQDLVQVPGLQGTPAYGPAQDALRGRRNSGHGDNTGLEGQPAGHRETNGNIDEFISNDSLVPQFRSVNADTPTHPEDFEDPEEDVQDKVLFVLNNVSEQNLSAKITEIADALEPRHYQWFASYLVEQRAKSQPNYQQLYLDLLGLLGDKHLWADVLRETYVSVRKVLNAESTMKNAADRTYLKNLGTWLGSLTIARDKPIKHKNIAFKELLIEGWETQRLLLVIPFTCEVLAQGSKSVVFKPPNPWIMEIIGLLLELYDLPDLKIQQKFAVEVLLGGFGLPRNGDGLDRSTELKKRQQNFEAEMAEPMIPDGLEAFDDLAIGNLNRGVRNARLSPTAIASSLPDLSGMLVFPPASSSPNNQARLRQVVQAAVQRSIMEIIGPVVERSVTIATIATKDLVVKDYAQEPDEERLREAFENVAKATSGSLASVTCKEPLRMSITNYIRNAAQEMPDQQPLPEGAILMCVNDNLEIACKIVEKQAEEKALPEIKAHIDIEIAKRLQHKANFPNEPYRDPATSHWSSYIPEPYKQMPGGLNQQQLDIYQHFAPQARGIINHNQTASTDSGKQIPDVLQEAGFPNVPNLSTPAEPPAMPHQPQPQLPQGNLPLALTNARTPSLVNGYMDGATLQEHMHDSIAELTRLAREEPDHKFRDVIRDSPVMDILSRIPNFVRTSPDVDSFALQTASLVLQMLYSDGIARFEVEILAQILKQLCQASTAVFSKLSLLFRKVGDEKVLIVSVTTALLEVGLMEYPQVDMVFAREFQNRNIDALQAFSELLDMVLFDREPLALRADFGNSLGIMGEWLSLAPNLEPARDIVAKLRSTGVPEAIDAPPDQASRIKREQMQYVFQEWLALFSHPGGSESMHIAFVTQLHKDEILDSQEDMALFLRLSTELAADSFERAVIMNPNLDPNEAHFQIDALARFIIVSVKNQGHNNGNSKHPKSSFMKSILYLLVLVLNNQHAMRGEHFSQRTFFRLFSTIFYDWHQYIRESDPIDDRNTILAFAETILLLEPHYFPAFTYGWLSMVSHRVFMPAILKNVDSEGSDVFAKIMEAMLSYVSGLLRTSALASVARDLYRGVLRILLILHHDFPEFLAENHYRLCNVIPAHCTQLRNLVLSAFPSSIFELPDPFSAGLKVDRLDDIRKAPAIAGDLVTPLNQWNLKDRVDNLLDGSTISDETIAPIIEALQSAQNESSPDVDSALAHSLVLYVGQSAISTSSSNFKNTPTFSNASPHAMMMSKLVREVQPEIRYHLVNAVANQLRYPNSHTHFFSYALLHLFGTDQADQQESDIRQQITRVLLERLIVHRPHPWGLIITLLELLKNPVYMFWELPFIKAAPEIEKLFGALFTQINQSPRPLV